MVAKLTDVAKLAGVSPTTVSRVINKKGYLSEITVQKVHEAMRELGYKPNNFARSLQGKSAKLIGLIFPNISNIFYAELIEDLEKELFKKGYKTIICNSENDADKEKEYLEMLIANQVDGIISSSHNLGITDYEKIDAPIIAFDRKLGPGIPIISSDNYAGGNLAAKQLKESGCKKTLLITGNDNTDSPTTNRAKGFLEMFPNAKIVKVPHSLCAQEKEVIIESILLIEKPDGVFVSDDETALNVIQICEKLEMKVPEDIKIIGYDGSQFVQTYLPYLTTICQPIEDIAQLVVEVLLKRIHNEPTDLEYKLPVTIQIGKTT